MQRGECFATVGGQAPLTTPRMPGRAALLVLTLGLAATAQKSKLTLDPPWSTVFLKESVTLMCSGSRSTAQSYTWYHDDKTLRTQTSSHRIGKAYWSHAGRYRCVAPGSRQSDSVQLTISDEWLILQAPYYAVFEGDPLCLRCHGWKGAEVSGIRYYRNGAEIPQFRESSELSMEKATTRDSGRYKCTGSMRSPVIYYERTSPEVFVSIQELFSTPVLRTSGSADPTEGNPVTLSCVTQRNPQKSDTVLQSIFYKDSKTVRAAGSSPDYHIPAVRLEDSGSYHCVMQTVSSSVWKPSSKLTIAVKRIPVSRVSLGVQPLGEQVVEGERLVLTCSVAEGLEPFTFSWHRQDSRQALKSEIQHSQRAVYEIPAATENDTGEYYCTVTSGNTRALSPGVKVAVKVPVSPPLLTINATGTWAAVGDMVEIRCESSRGSAPILYRFYHEGAILGSSTVSSRGPGSLALHVTSEGDAGTYSCETDNGMANSSQRSAPFRLSVLVPVSEATIVADPMGLEVRAGGSLNLSCLLESGTTPRFKWIHNNQELAMASEFGPPTAVGNTLHFWSVQLSHGGNYQCIASNQLSPQRVFQAPSEILAITVIEDASPQVAVTGTISFLCLMGVTAALVFYFKPWKKAGFSLPRRGTPGAQPSTKLRVRGYLHGRAGIPRPKSRLMAMCVPWSRRVETWSIQLSTSRKEMGTSPRELRQVTMRNTVSPTLCSPTPSPPGSQPQEPGLQKGDPNPGVTFMKTFPTCDRRVTPAHPVDQPGEPGCDPSLPCLECKAWNAARAGWDHGGFVPGWCPLHWD